MSDRSTSTSGQEPRNPLDTQHATSASNRVDGHQRSISTVQAKANPTTMITLTVPITVGQHPTSPRARPVSPLPITKSSKQASSSPPIRPPPSPRTPRSSTKDSASPSSQGSSSPFMHPITDPAEKQITDHLSSVIQSVQKVIKQLQDRQEAERKGVPLPDGLTSNGDLMKTVAFLKMQEREIRECGEKLGGIKLKKAVAVIVKED